jgi:hypothetical protein
MFVFPIALHDIASSRFMFSLVNFLNSLFWNKISGTIVHHRFSLATGISMYSSELDDDETESNSSGQFSSYVCSLHPNLVICSFKRFWWSTETIILYLLSSFCYVKVIGIKVSSTSPKASVQSISLSLNVDALDHTGLYTLSFHLLLSRSLSSS